MQYNDPHFLSDNELIIKNELIVVLTRCSSTSALLMGCVGDVWQEHGRAPSSPADAGVFPSEMGGGTLDDNVVSHV